MQEVKLQETKGLAEALVEVVEMLLQLHKVIRVVQGEVEVHSHVLESVVPVAKCPSCTTSKVKNRLSLMVCR